MCINVSIIYLVVYMGYKAKNYYYLYLGKNYFSIQGGINVCNDKKMNKFIWDLFYSVLHLKYEDKGALLPL